MTWARKTIFTTNTASSRIRFLLYVRLPIMFAAGERTSEYPVEIGVFKMVYRYKTSWARTGGLVPITVLLTDDKDVVRNSIRLLLGSDPEIRMVGEAANFEQAIQCAIDLKPQIVLMDLHMPDDSLVKPQKIKSVLEGLGPRLIAISFWDDESTKALARSLGAVMLLDKLTLATELIPAIKAACIKQRSASV